MSGERPWADDEQWGAAEVKAAVEEHDRVQHQPVEAGEEAGPVAPGRVDPGPLALEALSEQGDVAFLPEAKTFAEARTFTPPDQWESFGFVGAFAELVSEDDFIPGILVLRIDPGLVGSVAVETLAVFRWDDATSALRRVAYSGAGEAGGYVWAQISRPGLYATVGLNADPILARVVRALWGLRSILALLPDARSRVLECLAMTARDAYDQLDVSAPEVASLLAQDDVADGVPLVPFDWKRPDDENVVLAERIGSLRPAELPEFQLLSSAYGEPSWRG